LPWQKPPQQRSPALVPQQMSTPPAQGRQRVSGLAERSQKNFLLQVFWLQQSCTAPPTTPPQAGQSLEPQFGLGSGVLGHPPPEPPGTKTLMDPVEVGTITMPFATVGGVTRGTEAMFVLQRHLRLLAS
jgi:hypothetical protein